MLTQCSFTYELHLMNEHVVLKTNDYRIIKEFIVLKKCFEEHDISIEIENNTIVFKAQSIEKRKIVINACKRILERVFEKSVMFPAR